MTRPWVFWCGLIWVALKKSLDTPSLKEQVHPLLAIVVTTIKRRVLIIFMWSLELSYLSYSLTLQNRILCWALLNFNTKNVAEITNQLRCVNITDKDTAVTKHVHIISSHTKRISHKVIHLRKNIYTDIHTIDTHSLTHTHTCITESWIWHLSKKKFNIKTKDIRHKKKENNTPYLISLQSWIRTTYSDVSKQKAWKA